MSAFEAASRLMMFSRRYGSMYGGMCKPMLQAARNAGAGGLRWCMAQHIFYRLESCGALVSNVCCQHMQVTLLM
jgi:hypothetical protein